jgi:hypothetical protein
MENALPYWFANAYKTPSPSCLRALIFDARSGPPTEAPQPVRVKIDSAFAAKELQAF